MMAKNKIIDSGSIWFEGSSVGSTLYPPGSTLGPRIQGFVQLVFLHEGSMTIHIDDLKHKLAPDHVALLLPGHEEYFEFSKRLETLHSYVHIRPSALATDTQLRLSSLQRILPTSKAMENLIHQAITSNTIILSTRSQILETLALQLLWHYIGEAEALGVKQGIETNQRVPKAQLYIHDHLAQDLDLELIAEAVNLSKNQLIRIFKKELGISPINYLWQLRTSVALESLKHSGLSIDEITERCGFASRYHLSRKVKEHSGLAPAEYRRQYWQSRQEHFPNLDEVSSKAF